jgi:hypothetical protein
MRNLFMILTGLAAGVLLAGCFEGKADLTFNPDGTGKMVGEITFPMEAPWTAAYKVGDELKTPEEKMKAVVANIIKKSKGIDAWKDVSFEQAPGGRVLFKGTAYFKTASAVTLFPDTRPRIGFGGEGADGAMLILARGDMTPVKPPAFKALSADESAKAVKDQREAYKKLRPSIASQIQNLKFNLDFYTPGVVGEIHGLKAEEGYLSASVDGMRMLGALDGLVNDNAYMRDFVTEGGMVSMKWATDEIRPRLYANKGEVWAKVGDPLRPKFDYAAEMGAAKVAMPAMMVKLGLEASTTKTSPTPTVPPKAAPKTTTPPAKTPSSPTKAVSSIPALPSTPALIPTTHLPL